MGFSASDFLPLVIEKVNPIISENFELTDPFLKRLSSGTPIETNNRGVRLVARVRQNPEMMLYNSDGGTLPPDGTSVYVDMRVYYTSLVIAGGFTKQALQLNDTKVLINLIKKRMDDDMRSLAKQTEVMCFQKGDGKLATIANGGISGSNITMTAPMGASFLLIGGTYNFWAPDGTPRVATHQHCKVTAIAHSTGVATFNQVPSDIQAGDIVTFRLSYGRGLHGLPYIVNNDSGDYQGQSRGVYPELRATVFDSQSASISPPLIDRVIALNEFKMGIDVSTKTFEIWTSSTQYQSYMNQGYSFLRFMASGSGGGKFNGTYGDGVKHGNLTWNKALDCPDDTLYGLRMDKLDWYELEKMQVLKDDGLTMRLIPDLSAGADEGAFKAGFVYYIGMSGDMGCQDPRNHFAITNLSTSNLPTRMAAL